MRRSSGYGGRLLRVHVTPLSGALDDSMKRRHERLVRSGLRRGDVRIILGRIDDRADQRA
jgi:hypothetical protein